MGLDTTHDCWHGPYSSFNDWRREIARAVGIPLPLMEGFASRELRDHMPDDVCKWLPLKWEILKPDVIHVLLNHSDYDGVIESKDCEPLADRLEEIADMDSFQGGDWYLDAIARFATGLRLAGVNNENVEFH